MRFDGRGEIHEDDDLANREWEESWPPHRRRYGSSLRPGASIADPVIGHQEIERATASEQRAHFAVVVLKVDACEWLRVTPHLQWRARFEWKGEPGTLTSSWVNP